MHVIVSHIGPEIQHDLSVAKLINFPPVPTFRSIPKSGLSLFEFVKTSNKAGQTGGLRDGEALMDVSFGRTNMTCFIAGDSPFG